MKKFILTSVKFVAIVLLLLIILIVGLKMAINKEANFKLENQITSVIFGHSHSKCSLNDSLLQEFVNLSNAGEGYVFTYYKVKKILESNAHIKNIFLEYTNVNFRYNLDGFMDTGNFQLNFASTFPVIDVGGLRYLAAEKPKLFLSQIPKIMMEGTEAVFSSKRYIDEYWHQNERIEKSLETSIPAVGLIEKSEATIGSIPGENYITRTKNLWYLGLIANLCKQRGVQLYFLRSPLYQEYERNNCDSCSATELKESMLKIEYSEWLLSAMLQNEFKGIPFLDFKYYPASAHEFADYTHLNDKGSKRFTQFFHQLIDGGILEQDSPQHLIDSLINIENIKFE